jgi:hypothetical protein
MSGQKFLKCYEEVPVSIDLDEKDLVTRVIKEVLAKF